MDEILKEVLQLQELEVSIMPPSFYELAQHNGLPVEESLLDCHLTTIDFERLKLRGT
jgi:hypothetical protein